MEKSKVLRCFKISWIFKYYYMLKTKKSKPKASKETTPKVWKLKLKMSKF